MIYELLKKQVQQNTAFLNVYGRAKKQKKNEVTTNSFGTKLTKIIEFPLYDGTPLVPNANKKDLVFFERVGNVRDISDSYYSVLEEDFKVIVWLNKDTFDVSGKTYNGDIDIIVKELNRALISNKNSYILSIEFENATDENVFSSYTFSDAENAMTIEPFSAFELNYKIKYLASCNNLDSNIVVLNSECEPIGNQSNGKIYVGDTEVTIKNTTGETLYFESIPATQDREFEIQNSIYRVYNPQGELLAEGEIPAEGVKEITVSLGFDDLPRIVNTEDKDVGHENDVTWIVEDSTVIIKNTEDTELYSVDVPAEDSREQIINDSQAIIKDSSGNVLKSESILAEGSKDITVQDSEVDVKNTTGATLYSESVLAEGSKDITIQDSEVEIKNSAGTTLYSENIPAEENEEFTIQDSTATIKDTDNNILYSENILAEDNKDITIQDSSFTVKNSEEIILNQSNILAQGSGEYTVQDSKVVIKDKFGNIIEQDNITAEGSKEFTVNTELPVKNTEGQDVGTEINEEIIVGDSNIIVKDSEDNVLINFDVPAENSEEKAINDSTAIIKDSSGNTLKSESILAEGSKDITVQDSEVDVKNTTGATLYSESILAEGSKDITIQDSEVEIKNSAGTTLYSENIPAEENEEFTIQDSTATIKDTDNNILYSESILAEDSKDITIQDSTFTVKNSEDNVLKQDSILAQGSGEYTVQDSEVVIKDKFGNIIEQDTITAEGSKEFTVNTELPVKNTEGDEVGTEINEEIIVGDSNITVKDSEDNILSNFDVPAENSEEKVINDSTAIIKDTDNNILKSESILAERSKDITIADSTSIIKDSLGSTLHNESILAEGTKETTIADSTYVVKNQDGDIIAQGSILAEGSAEIVVESFRGDRPLILTYNTNLYTDAIIELSGVGTDPKNIIVRDSLGVVVKSLNNNTNNTVLITDLPAGIYDVEVSTPETSRMDFNTYTNARVRVTLVELKQWGDVVWGTELDYLFWNCRNLMITADDLMKMTTVGVTDRVMNLAFREIAGITNMNWVEALPIYTMTNIAGLFYSSNGVKDVVLDFNNASHLANINNMFIRIAGGVEYESIIINNMGSTLTATGNILNTDSIPTLHTLIYNDLQLSQDISGFTNGTPQAYIDFFENIGDRTGKDQRTITMRIQDWDKLDTNQKDYVDNILNDKNWALAQI